MKNKFPTFLVLTFTLLNGILYPTEHEYPSETVIFNLPNNSENTWKEISHYVNKKEGWIENIPLNQKINNWSELICIQYFDISTKNKEAKNDIKTILDLLKNETLSSYPNKVTWKIIRLLSKLNF